LSAAFAQALPAAHLAFLRGLEPTFTCGDFFFVHAGVRPGVALAKQQESDLLWIREDFLLHEEPFGKIIVHGHTPVGAPDIRPNRINIDTGAYATNTLTCLVLEADTMALSPHDRLRAGALAFAGIVGLGALWLTAAAVARPAPRGFPADAAGASAAAQDRGRATLAARLGAVRGDLWAQCAVTYADLAWTEPGPQADAAHAQPLDQARAVAERAVVAAPHDARMWLLLASLEARMDWVTRRGASLLRMSYYTGPNEPALVPLRLATFGRLDASADDDLQQLVRRELANVVNRRPDLTWAVVAAYREALPAGKSFFETVLRDLDPKLLATLRS
jgi:hypothetical protein